MADGEGLIIKIFADAKDFNTGVSKAIGDAKSKFKGLGDELGKELKRVETVGTTAFNGITGAIGVMAAGATAAIGGLVKSATDSFSEYQQLEGGVETLFKDSAGIIKDYAMDAYKTAGISANQYMETVTGFSASLIQSLGGDTEKAANYANRALVDMSDNANKMGSSMESIQNAYQGFAKQNYTMLDNLKLGYGGTKEEMERLIEDASKMTAEQEKLGITVDANSTSFGNIVNAISVMQEHLGIAGTTLEEAEKTVSGSLGMVKASWADLQTSIAGGGKGMDQAIKAFTKSVETYARNLLPVIKESLNGISDVITGLTPVIIGALPELVESVLPGLIESVKSIADTLGSVIGDNLGGIIDIIAQTIPGLIEVGVGMVEAILQGLSKNTGKIKETAPKIIHSLADGMRSIMNELLPIARELIGTITEGFIEYKTLIFEMGIQIITTLIQGLADAAPQLAPQLVDAVLHLLDVLIENLPTLIDAAVKIITELTNAIMAKLPDLLAKVGQVVYDFCNKLLDNLPELLEDAVKIVAAVLALIADILIAAGVSIWQHLKKWWDEKIKPWFDGIGKNISNWWDGVKKSAKEKLDKIKEVVKGCVDMIKSDVKNKIEEIKTNISTTVENIKTAVKEKVSDIKTSVSEKVNDIKTNLSEKVSDIKTSISEKVTDIKTKVVDTVTNLKTSISDKISAIKTNVTTKVEEIKTNIKDKVSSIKDTIINTIEELPGKMASIGKNIVEGLWNGILGAGEWLKDKVTGFFGGITDWVKGIFDEHSPSKVFEQIGGYLTEGLAIGIDDETDMLKNTAQKQINQLKGIYDGISLGAPRFAGSGSALPRMKQSIQTITNDNGNVFNFYQTFEGADAAAGEAMFRQFQRKVRYAGGVL